MFFLLFLICYFCINAQVDYERINNYQKYIAAYKNVTSKQNRKNVQQLLCDVISSNIENEDLATSIFETYNKQPFIGIKCYGKIASLAVEHSFFLGEENSGKHTTAQSFTTYTPSSSFS